MRKYFLIASILIVLALLIFPRTFSNQKLQKPKETKTLTGLEIAKQAVTFLDKTIKPDGGYYFYFTCDTKNNPPCQPKEFFGSGHAYYKPPPHFGHLTLAFYDLGKKTNDKALLDTANKQMEFTMRACNTDLDYCLWNFSPLIVYYNTTKDVRYKNAMLKASNELLKEKPLIESLNLNSGIKLKALYDITNDKRFSTSLTKETDLIMTGGIDKDEFNPILYKEGDTTVRTLTFKTIWSNILPSYFVTKNEKYLNFAKDMFAKAKLRNHVGKLGNIDEMQLLIFALDAELQMASADASAKDTYLSEAHDLAQYVYTSFADTPELHKFNDDFGFVDPYSEFAGNNIKDSLSNGWIVRHFVKLANDTFTIN